MSDITMIPVTRASYHLYADRGVDEEDEQQQRAHVAEAGRGVRERVEELLHALHYITLQYITLQYIASCVKELLHAFGKKAQRAADAIHVMCH